MLLFIFPLPLSFNKCIWSTYCVLGIVPDAEDKVGRQTDAVPSRRVLINV